MLSRLALMVQAGVLGGQFLDLFSPFNDGCLTLEVDIAGRHIADALVVAVVVVMIDQFAVWFSISPGR